MTEYGFKGWAPSPNGLLVAKFVIQTFNIWHGSRGGMEIGEPMIIHRSIEQLENRENRAWLTGALGVCVGDNVESNTKKAKHERTVEAMRQVDEAIETFPAAFAAA